MVRALADIDIIYSRETQFIYKPLKFSLKITEGPYLDRFQKVTYTITYNHHHDLTYDLNVKAGIYTKPLFTYYNPASRQYLVKEAYCFFSKDYKNRPILFGFKTNNDESYYYTYYELEYAKRSYTIAVPNIHKIHEGRVKSRLNQEADIIEKENTLKGKYEKGYGCVFLGNKGTSKKEYVVNLGSKVLCSITPSKEQCSYCRNVEIVKYKIVYTGDPQYHLWENYWYQWSNSYYYIYVYSGPNYKNKGTLIYTYYPRNNDYTAIYVLVFYSVLYVNDPFYIVFSTKEEYNLVSSFDVIKSKGSGYSYDFLSVSEDHVPQNVREAYSKFRKLKFELGRYSNQHVNTFPPQDSESSRLTYGGKKYKKVIFTPDKVSYQVTGHILFSCRLFSINASEGSCPYGTSKFQESPSDKDKIRNKPIKDEALKDVKDKDFNGVIVFYTNEQIRIDKSFQGTKARQNRDYPSDRFTVPENVAILVEFIVDCNTKTQFVRNDVDGNEWVKKEVDYKSDDELVKKLDEIVENLQKPESRKKLEEELATAKAKPKPEPAPRPPPQPPRPQAPTSQIPTDVRRTTSPTHSGKPTGTERTSQKPTSSHDSGTKGDQISTQKQPSLPDHVPSPSIPDPRTIPGSSGRDKSRSGLQPSVQTSVTVGSTSQRGASVHSQARPTPDSSVATTTGPGKTKPAPIRPPTGPQTRQPPGVPASVGPSAGHPTRSSTSQTPQGRDSKGNRGTGVRGQSQTSDKGQKGTKQPNEKGPQRTPDSTSSRTTHQLPPQSYTRPQEHQERSSTPLLAQKLTGKEAIFILIEEKNSYNFSDSGEFSYVIRQNDETVVLNQENNIIVNDNHDAICARLVKSRYEVVEHNFNGIVKSVSYGRNQVELKIFIKDYSGYRKLRLYENESEEDPPPIPLYYEPKKTNLHVYFHKDNSKPLLFCYNNVGYRPVSDSEYDQNWVRDNTISECPCVKQDDFKSRQLLDSLNKVKNLLNKYDKKPQVIYYYDDSQDAQLTQYDQDTSKSTDEGSNTSTIIGGSVGGVISTAAVTGGVTVAFRPELIITSIKALV